MNAPHTELHHPHTPPPPPHEDRGLHVRVTYNGVTKQVEYKNDETLGQLRESSIRKFGNLPNAHALSLFTEAGVEFTPNRDQERVGDAGIHDNEHLLLRPGEVRGG